MSSSTQLSIRNVYGYLITVAYRIVDNSDMDKGWTLTSGNRGTPVRVVPASLVLTVSHRALVSFRQITLSTDNGSDNQRWTFTPV
jgi:hypothetical protein